MAFYNIFQHMISCGWIFTKLVAIIDIGKGQIHYVWALSWIWIDLDISWATVVDLDFVKFPRNCVMAAL